MTQVQVDFTSAGIGKPLGDFDKLAKATAQVNRVTETLRKQQGLSAEAAKAQAKSLGITVENVLAYRNAIAKAEKDTAALAKEQARSAKEGAAAQKKALNEIAQAQARAAKEAAAFAKAQIDAYRILAQFGGRAFSAVNDSLQDAVTNSLELEDAIKKVGQITGTTGTPKIRELEQTVSNLASTTSKTPAEIAKVAIELSRLGFSADQSVEALESIVKASEATGTNLSLVGSVVATTINQFGLAASDAQEVADLLVQTANNSGTSIAALGQSLKFAGRAADESDQSLQSTLVLLGAIGDAGLKGGIGGRNLAKALEQIRLGSADAEPEIAALVRGSERLSGAVNALGVEFRDSDQSLFDLVEKLPELRAKLSEFDQGEQDLILKALFGTEGQRAISAILAKTDGELADLANTIADFEGASEKASQELKAGLSGALTQLDSNLTTLSTTTGQVVSVGLEPLARAALALVQLFNSLPVPIQKVVIGLAGVTTAITAAIAILAAYNLAIKTGIVQQALLSVQILRNEIALARQTLGLRGVTIAQAAYNVVLGKADALQVQQIKNILNSVKGYAATAAAIGAVALAFNSFQESTKTLRLVSDDLKTIDTALQGLKESTDDITDSTEQYATQLDRIKANQNFFAKLTDGAINFTNATNPLIGSLDRINKLFGGDGIKLATIAQAEYESQVAATDETVNAVNSTLNALDQALLDAAGGTDLTVEQMDRLEQALNASGSAVKKLNGNTDESVEFIDAQAKAVREGKERFDEYKDSLESTSTATDRLAASSRSLQSQLLDIDASVAVQQAFIAETVDNEEERQKLLTQVQINGSKERLSLLQVEIADINKELANPENKDKREEIENQLNQVVKQASDLRIAIANDEQAQREEIAQKIIDVIIKAREDATAEIIRLEQDRILAIETQLNDEVIDKQDAENAKLLATKNRLDAEIVEIEKQIKTLENIRVPFSPEREAENTALIAQLRSELTDRTIELKQQERAIEESLNEQQIAELESIGDLQRTNTDVAIDGLARQSDALGSQIDLVKAVADLEKSISNQRLAGLENELKELDRANQLRRQIAETSVDDLNTRARLQNELNATGLAGIQNEVQAIEKRQQIENQLFNEKRNALKVEFEAAKQIQELEIQKSAAIAQQNLLRIEGARIQAQLALDVAKAQKEVDVERVGLLERILDNVNQQVSAAKAQITSQSQLANLSRQTLANTQGAALAALDREQSTRNAALETQKLNAQTGGVAASADKAATSFSTISRNARSAADSMTILGRELSNQNKLLNDRIGAEEKLLDLQIQQLEKQKEQLEAELESKGVDPESSNLLDRLEEQIAKRQDQLDGVEAENLDLQIAAAEKQLESD